MESQVQKYMETNSSATAIDTFSRAPEGPPYHGVSKQSHPGMCKEKTQFVLKKFCRHLSVSLLNLFLALEAFKRTCITRFTEKYINVQLSLSSRGLHGGAYFSDVSGRKSILTSATEAYDHTESYRLLGFCLTITFCLNPAHQAVSL